MSNALVLLVAVPLLAAAAAAAARGSLLLRRVLALATTGAVLAAGVALCVLTRDGDVPATQVAAWPGGIAIPFAADAFTALLLTVTALLVLACTVQAALTGEDAHPAFLPLVLVLSAGAYAAFLTGDLFNLFVAVEVMLVPSYVLLLLGRGRVDARRGTIGGGYVAVNLFASTLLLAGCALVYASAGTVNLGELAQLSAAQDQRPALALGGTVVLLSLAVKSAVVPVHGWLPLSYPQASPVVTALFSGILTKVGVYAAYRVYAALFADSPPYTDVLAGLAVVTMVVGVLGAVGRGAMREILSFHMVSQVGYLVIGLALFTVAGVSAAVFYLVQYVVVKAALFLCAAAVVARHGTDRLDRLGGMALREPGLALAFLAAAFSLVGLPPFSGFVGKLVLILAAADAGSWVLATVAVVVGLFTLLSMLKIWTLAFWGDPPEREEPAPSGPAERGPERSGVVPLGTRGTGALPTERVSGAVSAAARAGAATTTRTAPVRTSLRWLPVPPLVLAALSLALGLGAEPLLDLAGTAAAGLVDPSAWAQAVRT